MDEKHPIADPNEDEAAAVARVAAADPAATAEPDAVALRDAVEERRRSAPPDELAVRRMRRLTTWPARAAAVAAAALVVGGGGGYALGAAGAGGGDGGEVSADPPIVLQAPGGAVGATEEAGGGVAPAPTADLGAGGSGAARLGGYDTGWGGWYGRSVFHASGLSGDGGSALAWALDATASASADGVASAAAALGVAGEPRLEYGSWTVGPNDGSGPTVQLSADGAGSLSYWDPTRDAWYCEAAAVDTDPAGRDDGAGIDPVEPAPCGQRDLGDAPSGDDAMARLREAMTALGVDVAAFELSVLEDGDPAYVHVTARHVVAGQQTGLAWSATFSGAGLTGLYGFTARVVELGEYGVVSPAEAVARLNDPRFGGGWSGPIVMAGTALPPEIADAPEEPDGVPPAPATSGDAIAWPVRDVTIVGARLGVAQASTREGAVVLVPTYELTADDGSVWSVIAVADDGLDFATG